MRLRRVKIRKRVESPQSTPEDMLWATMDFRFGTPSGPKVIHVTMLIPARLQQLRSKYRLTQAGADTMSVDEMQELKALAEQCAVRAIDIHNAQIREKEANRGHRRPT